MLGLPKCGTTSLQHALESAGYGTVHCYAPKPWGPEPAEADLPGLHGKTGAQDDELLTWFEGHTARVRRHFAGREAGKFLEIALEEEDCDLKEKLEAFLHVPVVWGHHNRTTWT